MSYAAVEIVNISLAYLGRSAIQTFGSTDDDPPAARIGERAYRISLDSLAADHEWSFLRVTEYLNLVDDDHPMGVRYKMPTSCVVPRRIGPTTGVGNNWIVEGRHIIIPTNRVVADGMQPYLIHTSAPTDPGIFPPSFVYALAMHIAGFLCMPLTEDVKKQASIDSRAEHFANKAKLIDANVGRFDHEGMSDLMNDSFNNPDAGVVGFDG